MKPLELEGRSGESLLWVAVAGLLVSVLALLAAPQGRSGVSTPRSHASSEVRPVQIEPGVPAPLTLDERRMDEKRTLRESQGVYRRYF